MYLDYFGLTEAPFSITPDPSFVYLSARHRDALAHLLYGVGQGGSGGFVQLTGEVGTGKTTLCRCLLEQVPEDTEIALVLNPLMTPSELVSAICEELGVEVFDAATSSKAMVDRLNEYLLHAHEQNKRVVVVIDEAQNLSPESLEQVRLLTNLETSKQKLLQIVLLGQPELRELLQRRSLRQLAQRITARYHLTPLNTADTAAYVAHRMNVAGAARNPFKRSAMKALFQRSQGVPRLINIIADRALVAAYARERQDVDGSLVHAAADEVQLGEPSARRARWPLALAGVAGLALAALAWKQFWPQMAEQPAAPIATLQQSPSGNSADAQSEPSQSANAEAGVVSPASATVVEPEASNPVPEVPAQQPQLPRQLDPQWLAIQEQAAWRGMAALWGDAAEASAIEQACNGEGSDEWACLAGNGSFARISQLGLPVILRLQGEGEGWLLLQGLDSERVLVGAPGTGQTHRRSVLEQRWLGSYMVAWPQKSNWPREIARGDSGVAVETVLRMADLAEPPYEGAREFSAEFESWLIRFQRRYGLDTDGIVGPRTLLYLMRPSITRPQLKQSWQEE